MMIHVWYDFYPELALYALKCLVDFGDDGKTHQYGSWKDIKYFCNYCYKQNCRVEHPLIQYSINLINTQIKKDYDNINEDEISLAGKWAPREKSSRFGWMYQPLACQYFLKYIQTAGDSNKKESMTAAILKCKMDYRKILSSLNNKIETVQIKQCGKTWRDINFNKVTSVTLSKQRKAFLNVNKKGQVKYPTDLDRIECAEHFNAHIQKAIKGEVEMKGKRVGLADFTKQAIDLNREYNSSTRQIEKDLLNSQWRDNSSQNNALGDMIAMVDTSGSMYGDPINAAIALGIRVAEKSKLGKRIMTFNSSPKWVNLEGQNDFCSMVKTVAEAEWGMSTNFNAALNMILDAIISAKMEPEDVEGLTLAIFSDMQMDAADYSFSKTTLYDNIKEKYADAGMRVKGKPYKAPHILFWNLRSSSGFPTLSTQTNASMMSGFSPTLLNLFCEEGLEALQSCTPWSLFIKSLDNERYKILDQHIRENL
jgi:Mg-chelatase subunit ChlD